MAESQKKGQDFLKSVETFFDKLPKIPASGREAIVTASPWVALILGVFSILGGFKTIGYSPAAMFFGFAANYFIIGLAGIVSGALMLMAYPKLSKKAFTGWKFFLWAMVVNIVSAVITVNLQSLLFIFIGVYLLFQIKSYYK